MKTILVSLIFLSACAESEPIHHINQEQGFCLTIPGDFEEFRLTIDDGTEQVLDPNEDFYYLHAPSRTVVPEMEVGVNHRSKIEEGHILIEYVFEIQDDGSVIQTDRKFNVPETYRFPHIAASLFFSPDKKKLFFFKMDLEENGHEELFVDIVSSFQLLQ